MTDFSEDFSVDQLLIPTRSTSRPLMLTPPTTRKKVPEPRPESPLARTESTSARPESPLAAHRLESPSGSYRLVSGQISQIKVPTSSVKPTIMTTEGVVVTPAAVLFDDLNAFLSKLPLKTLGCFLALIYGMSMLFMLLELPPIWLVVVVSAASFIMFRVLGV